MPGTISSADGRTNSDPSQTYEPSAKLSACRAKCMTTKNKIYIYIYIFFSSASFPGITLGARVIKTTRFSFVRANFMSRNAEHNVTDSKPCRQVAVITSPKILKFRNGQGNKLICKMLNYKLAMRDTFH